MTDQARAVFFPRVIQAFSGNRNSGYPEAIVLKQTRLFLWRLLALVFVILGIIGIVLPGMPTVVFLLLAAWAGSKSWPELEQRLLDHPEYGPVIRQWREQGRVPRRAKWLASGMMLFSAVSIQFLPTFPLLRLLLPILLLGVAAWIWSRPDAE